MRKVKKVLCIFCALFIILNVSHSSMEGYADKYSNITSDSIKEKESQIKESEKIQQSIKQNLKDAKAVKQELEQYKEDVAKYITELDLKLDEIRADIEEYSNQIQAVEEEIEETEAELSEAINKEEEQYEAMKTRIKFMYERGDNFYLDVVFSAKSFGDLLTKADYIDMIEAYDRNMLEEYTQAREWTEICKATLESQRETLNQAKEALLTSEESIEELLDEKEVELSNYNAKIASAKEEIEQYQAQYEEEVAVIEQLEAQILEEKKAIADAQRKTTYDGGQFAWPCPDYVKVTEEFGWRTHPITGKAEFHTGIDLGAPAGSPILAAYDGKVVAAQYNWSMGNYVMIDHGDGLYTIYMHASKLYVSAGQVVVRGETIAAVGTTGSSTGNHLHFSVRLNGEYQNPWNYLQ